MADVARSGDDLLDFFIDTLRPNNGLTVAV